MGVKDKELQESKSLIWSEDEGWSHSRPGPDSRETFRSLWWRGNLEAASWVQELAGRRTVALEGSKLPLAILPHTFTLLVYW